MTKEAVEAAINGLEASGRSIDFWVLFCAVVVALSLTGEVVFSVAHWLNERQARPLRTQLATLNALEIAALVTAGEDAKRDAAIARLATEKLKTPRTLGPDRQQFVTAAAIPFKGQRYMTVISQGADDGLAFWESLYVTLEKAGWVYLPADSIGIGNPPAGIPIAAMPGVEIRFDPGKETEMAPAALALGNALHADGTIVAVNRNARDNAAEMYRDVLLISIGARVPPP